MSAAESPTRGLVPDPPHTIVTADTHAARLVHYLDDLFPTFDVGQVLDFLTRPLASSGLAWR